MHIRWKQVLNNCRLFDGLTSDDLPEALSLLDAHRREYSKGEIIIRFGEPMERALILLDGSIKCTMYEPIDNPFVIKHNLPGELIALPGACAHGMKSPIEAIATSNCIVFSISMKAFTIGENPDTKTFSIISANIIKALSAHAKMLNKRLRIISYKNVKDRIKVYLSTLPINEKGVIHLPLTMTDIANFIYVDKSAMYKTLRELKAAGILKFKRNQITILDKDFLEINENTNNSL